MDRIPVAFSAFAHWIIHHKQKNSVGQKLKQNFKIQIRKTKEREKEREKETKHETVIFGYFLGPNIIFHL